ncbi:MAG: CAP domain-containing protein, partial [Thermoproteus sp.]
MDECFVRALAELRDVIRNAHILEEWQLVSRISSVIRVFIEEGKERGCDGATAAREYIIRALEDAGIDRYRISRGYLHGTRDDVLQVLYEIFPNLAAPGKTADLARPRREVFMNESARPSWREECFPEALLELREVMRNARLLDDWQLVSRLASVARMFIDEGRQNGCDGASAAFYYISKTLDDAGIDRYRTYRAYLHGTRDDVLQVLYRIFPNLAQIRRPLSVEEAERGYTEVGTTPSYIYRRKVKTKSRGRSIRVALLIALFVVLIALVAYMQSQNNAPSWTATTVSVPTWTATTINVPTWTVTTVSVPTVTPIEITTSYYTSTATAPPSASVTSIQAYTTTSTAPIDDPVGFVQEALATLNQIRSSMGIPPVNLTTLNVAEFRAQYMARHDFLSHYDREGRHPIYYYTKLDGGKYAVEENGCACWRCRAITADGGKDMVSLMIYNDSSSQWGHRDSLLDPCNNYAAIAAARNGDDVYAVIYMVAKWANWADPPTYSNGIFYAKGYVMLPPPEKLPDGRPYYPILIYCDVPNPSYYYRRYYNIGQPCAGVLPPNTNTYYSNLATIRADVYNIQKTQNGWLVEVEFRYTPPPGVLATVVMFTSPTGVSWTPMSP